MAPKFKVGDVLKYTKDFLDRRGQFIPDECKVARCKIIGMNEDEEIYTLATVIRDGYNFFLSDEEIEGDEEDQTFTYHYIHEIMERANTLEQFVLDTLKKYGVI